MSDGYFAFLKEKIAFSVAETLENYFKCKGYGSQLNVACIHSTRRLQNLSGFFMFHPQHLLLLLLLVLILLFFVQDLVLLYLASEGLKVTAHYTNESLNCTYFIIANILLNFPLIQIIKLSCF